MKNNRNLRIIGLAGLFLLVCACMPGVSISLTDTQTPIVITATPQPPAATETTQPVPPATQAAAAQSAGTASAGLDHINIYLVAVGDNGASGEIIGCGDSLVPVQVSIEPTLGVLRAALTELFKLEGQADYGQSGLYNALYLSHLEIDDLAVVNGKATMKLSGQIVTGGECDIPRIEAQLRAIAMQFSTVQQVSITVNGVPLAELLDLRG
ncbi:GerMN domain-containing protein [Pelolinea submarina]|uniref:Sporulation and spore germination protein n=1 Tax=Pelolinea submarina TaxID=913107 RepID=A0A347ZNS2_9CHLR|nr:GerMN domain-containing protein [Pelolinea submarina]REG08556.1 sporulation and spore germination protein [Pelolinea submarina]BBB46953.1 hypothetical protein Pelsub_P0180 [Pelolinea submarina]